MGILGNITGGALGTLLGGPAVGGLGGLIVSRNKKLSRQLGNITKDYALPAVGATIGGLGGSLFGPAGAVAGASMGAKLGADIQGSVAEDRAKDRYENRANKARKDSEREQRRQAILSALGTKSMPRKVDIPEYKAPSMTGYNTIAGLGELGFMLGTSSMAESSLVNKIGGNPDAMGGTRNLSNIRRR